MSMHSAGDETESLGDDNDFRSRGKGPSTFSGGGMGGRGGGPVRPMATGGRGAGMGSGSSGGGSSAQGGSGRGYMAPRQQAPPPKRRGDDSMSDVSDIEDA